jgi:hypothetical protein
MKVSEFMSREGAPSLHGFVARITKTRAGKTFGRQTVRNIINGKGCSMPSAFWIAHAYPEITVVDVFAEAFPDDAKRLLVPQRQGLELDPRTWQPHDDV